MPQILGALRAALAAEPGDAKVFVLLPYNAFSGTGNPLEPTIALVERGVDAHPRGRRGGREAWTVDGRDQPAARGTKPGSRVVLALAVGALAVGGIVGWMAATSPSTPSYNYAGAVAGFWAMLFLLGVVAIAVIGLLALYFRSSWLAIAFVVGGGCLLGFVGGGWLTNAAGLGYKYTWPSISFPSPPVYLFARGQASARLDGIAGFATHSGSADCTSGPGSQVVATVDVWDAGELQGAMYRGDLHMHVAGIDPSTVGVSVFFWSSSMTGSPPQWHGQGRLVTDEPAAGRVAFERISLSSTSPGAPTATWPAELSGEISWSCGPWSSVRATQGP